MFHGFSGSYFCRMPKNKPISGPGQRSEWPRDLSKRSNVLLKGLFVVYCDSIVVL